MAITLECKVIPSSGRQHIMLDKTGVLKCYLKNPPESGRANQELIRLIAKKLNISVDHITILLGAKGRKKILKIVTKDSKDLILQLLGIEVQHGIF